MKFTVSGNIVDVVAKKIFPAEIFIENGVITSVHHLKGKNFKNYILPGLVDSHIHIESSMLSPSEFARNAVRFGTVATVSDPHEIANVLGIEGVMYMLEDGRNFPFKYHFGAPSCVPATDFETSGSKLTEKEIEFLFKHIGIGYLSEMMNFPGVINDIPDVMKKIEIARKYNLPIDGHAPGLRGSELKKYVSSGIATDHESISYDEAEEKILNGMKILIREGSAAKNFEELFPLLLKYPNDVMFCTDDLHPGDLLQGHINLLIRRAIERGADFFDTIRSATLNPKIHYNLPIGLLRVGDDADFIVVDDLRKFNVIETYVNGILVAKDGYPVDRGSLAKQVNKFNVQPKNVGDFLVEYNDGKKILVIEALDGELITNKLIVEPKIENGKCVSDIERDILKIAVVNRYINTKPSVGFVKNFGLKKGAIATSVAHDSHNIVAIGTKDELIVKAVNLVIEHRGGVTYVDENKQILLPLPIAGLMSDQSIDYVAQQYEKLENEVINAGSRFKSPLMTLSFMSLLVIPSLKISDLGLFDVEKFNFVNLFVE
ncbi:MAG: adenine deaminase [Ignavibacteria bacterium]|nr:adenine deaminase [Ignavibacteria bacterium]